MSQTGMHRWKLLLTFFARIFVAAFAVVTLSEFFEMQSPSFFSQIAQLILFAFLLVWRYLSSRPVFFVPDEMMLALPWFWLVSVSENIHQWHSVWLAAAVIIMILSAFSRSYCYTWFDGGITANSLYFAVMISAIFYFSFATLLSRVFADFTQELLIKSWHGGLWAFAGIFVMNAAFHSLFVAHKKAQQEQSPFSSEAA